MSVSVSRQSRNGRILGILVLLSGVCLNATPRSDFERVYGQSKQSSIAGTWTGSSICVGDRPACKNEAVVYRFLPVEGHPLQFRLLADKIIDGRRVPMGALVFDFDERTGKLRSEFTRGSTHGVWEFSFAGENLMGTLIVLPDRSVARDVKVHRTRDSEVPPAPSLHEYDG